LAISQWIAQAHSGRITVQSRLGRGSVFTVTLPLLVTAVESSAQEPAVEAVEAREARDVRDGREASAPGTEPVVKPGSERRGAELRDIGD
jgi:hypothetical protein